MADAKVTVWEMDEAIRVASLIARDEGSGVSMTILDAARAYIRRAAEVLGPECPECGHFLLYDEHHLWFDDHGTCEPFAAWKISCYLNTSEEKCCQCEMTVSWLITEHPEIARQCGLTVLPPAARGTEP